MRNDESGFTLIEMMSVLAATSLFVGLILYFGISYWRYSALLESDLSTLVSRLNSQDFIRETIGTTDGLINQNSIPDTNANNPDPVAGNNYWLPLHAVPGTISASNGTTTPLLYFHKFSTNTSNNIVMNGTAPYQDEYVLYINGSSRQLMLRTLANPNVANNKLKTSCPPSLATIACPADRMILDNFASVDASYFSRNGGSINYESIFDPNINSYAGPDFPSVEAIQYTLHVTQKTLFQTGISTINDTVIRIALRNT